MSGAADYIVSGDDDLLALHPFRNMRILTLEAFLTIMTNNETQQES